MLEERDRRELHRNQAVRKWHERYSHQEIKGTLVPSRRHSGIEVALVSHSVTQSLMFAQDAKQGSVSKVQQWSRRQNHFWWQKVNSKMDKDAKKRKKALQQIQPTDLWNNDSQLSNRNKGDQWIQAIQIKTTAQWAETCIWTLCSKSFKMNPEPAVRVSISKSLIRQVWVKHQMWFNSEN